METHETYIGIEPFTVLIDASPELEALVAQARELRGMPFEEKLEGLKKIAVGAMVNAYELWKASPEEAEREFNKDMVFSKHPLSYALQAGKGCCRYQGALFFVLGYEADLGNKHFIQQAPVNPEEFKYGTSRLTAKNGMRSVFNNILFGGNLHTISIFKESLQDKAFDYSVRNPNIFGSAIGFGALPKGNTSPKNDPWGMAHYSYHRTESGLVIVSEKSKHVLAYTPQEDGI